MMNLKSPEFKFALIICTYKRPKSLKRLLNSVMSQSKRPNQILVIDGSQDLETEEMLNHFQSLTLRYFRVSSRDRGLTRQRNFGISRIEDDFQIICFLDDDTVLQPDYFQTLLHTYTVFPDAIGAGGYISNDIEWRKNSGKFGDDEFEYHGWIRKLGSRNKIRKKLGLLSDQPPGVMPEFSNGLSISFLPPSGEIYPVEFFMGGVSSFRKDLFQKVQFSSFFEGYGLYEDLDFCLRASNHGQLYVNTGAELFHYHQEEGRPNKFNYGKMVILNGWYVWRIKYPSPAFKAILKWHGTAFLLTLIRLVNVVTTKKKKEALTESMGRIVGWWMLIFKTPKVER